MGIVRMTDGNCQGDGWVLSFCAQSQNLHPATRTPGRAVAWRLQVSIEQQGHAKRRQTEALPGDFAHFREIAR